MAQNILWADLELTTGADNGSTKADALRSVASINAALIGGNDVRLLGNVDYVDVEQDIVPAANGTAGAPVNLFGWDRATDTLITPWNSEIYGGTCVQPKLRRIITAGNVILNSRTFFNCSGITATHGANAGNMFYSNFGPSSFTCCLAVKNPSFTLTYGFQMRGGHCIANYCIADGAMPTGFYFHVTASGHTFRSEALGCVKGYQGVVRSLLQCIADGCVSAIDLDATGVGLINGFSAYNCTNFIEVASAVRIDASNSLSQNCTNVINNSNAGGYVVLENVFYNGHTNVVTGTYGSQYSVVKNFTEIAEPMLVDPANGDYRTKSTIAAIKNLVAPLNATTIAYEQAGLTQYAYDPISDEEDIAPNGLVVGSLGGGGTKSRFASPIGIKGGFR